jgi:hypothetical protein
MASLYSLQMSLINAGESGSQVIRATFPDVRKILKSSWEPILALLQKSHAFGSDVVLLKDSLQTESVEDCREFLMEMSATAGNLCELSKARVTESEDAVSMFCTQMPQMSDVLLKVSSVRSKPIRSRSEGYMAEHSHSSFHDRKSVHQGDWAVLTSSHGQRQTLVNPSSIPSGSSLQRRTKRPLPSLRQILPLFALTVSTLFTPREMLFATSQKSLALYINSGNSLLPNAKIILRNR